MYSKKQSARILDRGIDQWLYTSRLLQFPAHSLKPDPNGCAWPNLADTECMLITATPSSEHIRTPSPIMSR